MTAYYLLFVISSPYALERFNAAPSTAGLVAGLMLIGCLGGRFLTGRIIGTMGFARVLFTGLVLYIGSMGLYLVAHNLPFLMGVRFLSGVGIGCIGTATGTLIAHIVPQHQHGAGINYFSMSTILALAFGPFFGILMMRHVSYAHIFMICIVLGIVSFLLALIVDYPALEACPESHGNCSRFNWHEYVAVEALALAMVVLLAAVGYGVAQAFLSFYAGELNLMGVASLFFLVYAATAFCLRPVAGKLFDSRGANIVIYPSLAAAACGLLLLSRVDSATGLMLSAVLLGAGMGTFQTTTQASCIKLVPRHRFAQATSTYFIFFDLGIGLGPYLMGFIVPLAGYRGLYLAATVLVVLCVPLYHWMHGRKNIGPHSP